MKDQSKALKPDSKDPFDLYDQVEGFLNETRWGTHILVEDLLGALSTQTTFLDNREPDEMRDEVRKARTLVSLVAEKAGELSLRASAMSRTLDTVLKNMPPV